MSDADVLENVAGELPDVGVVLGDYRLEAIIAEGGMGRVYDAVHTKLGRPVALKMLLPSQAAHEDIRKRFFGEARAVNRIQHENLVSVTDFVDDDERFSYYIMERLPGLPLREIMAKEGIFDLARSVRILLQLADVLASLHEDQIVHRDLKPENIFIVPQASNPDFVKLIDFGVAQILDKEGELLLPSEGRGTLIGTPHYMAPEQAEGKPVDDLADIYAFGVLMFELFTGQHPLDADDLSDLLLMKRTVTPPEATSVKGLPHEIPDELNTLIAECLATNPKDRPQSMQEVRLRLMVLDAADQPLRVTPLPTGLTEPLRQKRQERQLRMRLGIGGAVLLLLVVVGWVIANSGTPENATPPPPVSLRLASSPAGAAVWIGDREIGKTPLAHSTPRSQKTDTFVFRLDGYEEVVKVLSLAADQQIEVLLIPTVTTPKDKPKRRINRRKKRKSKVRPGGFIDPFAK